MRLSNWRVLGRRLRYQRAARHLGKRCREPKFLLAILVLLTVILLVVWNRAKIFTLNVSTEVVQFTLVDSLVSEWMLGNTRLIDSPLGEESEAVILGDHSILMLNTGTQVRIQRHGTGQIRLLLTTGNQASAGRIEDAEGRSTQLDDWALLLVEVRDQPLVFPFRGKLTAGDDVAIGVDSILLAGTVSVVEEQLLGKTHYIAGVENLDPGDRVQLWRYEHILCFTTRPATMQGFIRAEPMQGFSEPVNALALVAHGQADFVAVERLGSAGYRIRAPRWARFIYDPLLAASTAIIALLALMLELSSKCVELVRPGQKPDKAPEDRNGTQE